jgi:biopolymer transport protein ExbD
MHRQNLYRIKKRRISLTALIDVVFILLLFFMLTTSFSQWRVINISTATSIQTESDEETMSLLLMPDASVNIYTRDTRFETYKDIKQTDLILSKGDEVIVLLPHQDVPLQLLIDATQHLKEIGLKDISIGHSFGEEIKMVRNEGIVL